jgi:hypothetical protein
MLNWMALKQGCVQWQAQCWLYLNLSPKKYGISDVACVCVCVSLTVRLSVSAHWHPPTLQVGHMVSVFLPVLITCHYALLYMFIFKYNDRINLIDVENTVGSTNL